MRLKKLEISGFKSFARKSAFSFDAPITAVVGPNGSGKSNVAEAIRFVLGEQSMKSLRGKRGEDLIWNGSQNAPRSNHASVSLIFDNRNRAFDLDFDEVIVRRDVYRDGNNQYFINGSQVRLRDIFELLAKVNIGASGHHIISQGEADHILSANVKERRTMIEEALGLKIYQWKIDESQKKLTKTQQNIEQVQSLRREITPHIKFLKKQVERAEKAQELQKELGDLYVEYLAREDAYLSYTKARLNHEIKEPKQELAQLEEKLARAQEELASSDTSSEYKERIVSLEKEMHDVRMQKDAHARTLGHLEGEIAAEKRRLERAHRSTQEEVPVPVQTVTEFTNDIQTYITQAEAKDSFEALRTHLRALKERVEAFVRDITQRREEDETSRNDIFRLETEKEQEETHIADLEHKEKELLAEYQRLREAIEAEKDSSRELERSLFSMMERKNTLSLTLNDLRTQSDIVERETKEFEEEVREGVVLVGSSIRNYQEYTVKKEEVSSEPRIRQQERKKKLEKMKIKLEDMGAGNEDIIKEYEEVTQREQFLLGEIEDLEKSAESLRTLIADLEEKLNKDFKEGIAKINAQFQDFFALMFGGGTASLRVVAQQKAKPRDTDLGVALASDEEIAAHIEEEETKEEGIDIHVALPRKKIKGLQMLSGGERALTSIALIFAVSQVNPPPFLVLDETDAALDEANSRKHGNMLESLSKHSQLIVITHNRETMSRAGALYGVTMGSDAVSRLLSVKFDEAADQFAK